MNFYRIIYSNNTQNFGAFTQRNVESNSTDRTSLIWRLSNIMFYIRIGREDRDVQLSNCPNGSILINNTHSEVKTIEDITMNDFKQAFEEIKKKTFVIYHFLPKDYDIAGISTPEKIIYIPSRGKEYNIEEHYVEMYFGPNAGSFPVPIRQAVARKEKVVEPQKKIENFEFVTEESTLCTSVYKLIWRNQSFEEFLDKMKSNNKDN